MNELKFYKPEWGWCIRTIEVDGEPWFAGKDVAEALEYQNASKALADHVDEEDKLNNESLSSLGQRGGWLINESGLYSLILSSKMTAAKAFKKWITSEVIPSIRKHGAYATPATIEDIISNPDFGIQLLNTLKAEQEKNRRLASENERMKPKEIFADAVNASKTSILIGELAKLIAQNGVQIGQRRLFSWLRDNGYLMRSGSSMNLPQQRYIEQGLFEIKENSITNPDGSVRVTKTTKVTGKGQIYFINKFLQA